MCRFLLRFCQFFGPFLVCVGDLLVMLLYGSAWVTGVSSVCDAIAWVGGGTADEAACIDANTTVKMRHVMYASTQAASIIKTHPLGCPMAGCRVRRSISMVSNSLACGVAGGWGSTQHRFKHRFKHGLACNSAPHSIITVPAALKVSCSSRCELLSLLSPFICSSSTHST